MKTEYNYELQVWLQDKIIQECGHCESGHDYINEPCCNANAYQGMHIECALRSHDNRMVGEEHGYIRKDDCCNPLGTIKH